MITIGVSPRKLLSPGARGTRHITNKSPTPFQKRNHKIGFSLIPISLDHADATVPWEHWRESRRHHRRDIVFGPQVTLGRGERWQDSLKRT